MTEELKWTRSERNKQIRDAVEFLVGSMGLDEGYVVGGGDAVKRIKERIKPVGLVERFERGVWWLGKSLTGLVGATTTNVGLGGGGSGGGMGISGEKVRVLGRSRFEVGEVGILKSVFDKHSSTTTTDNKGKLSTQSILEVVKQVSGYETITPKEFEHVLDETGFKGREELDWEEFLEVCGGLREVSVSPAEVSGHGRRSDSRRVIPVEKSGGGV